MYFCIMEGWHKKKSKSVLCYLFVINTDKAMEKMFNLSEILIQIYSDTILSRVRINWSYKQYPLIR